MIVYILPLMLKAALEIINLIASFVNIHFRHFGFIYKTQTGYSIGQTTIEAHTEHH